MKRTEKIVRVCFSVFLLCAAASLRADDWPTYRHDPARSGVSAEKLNGPLSGKWVFTPTHPPRHAWGDPQPKPVEGILELPRLRFDDAFHVAASGGLVFFGSSSECKVTALDAETGKTKWIFYTEGPVRLAPTVWERKVYVGSDDGNVYCLGARTGELIWRFNAAPDRRKLLGNGTMISLWPVRTGVVVDKGVAYFGAGVFPAEGIYLYAVDAENGSLLWKNDSYGRGGTGTVSPQGYIVASKTKLFVPSGRAMPAAFDRKDGRFLFHRNFNWRSIGLFGGTYALAAGDLLFNGTEQILGVSEKDGRLVLACEARRLLVKDDTVYILTGKECVAYRRDRWTEVTTRLQSLKSRFSSQKRRVNSLRQQVRTNKKLARQLQNEILLLRRIEEERRTALQEQKDCVRWRSDFRGADSLVASEGMILAGGPGKVAGFDSKTGTLLWSAQVDGRARGIALARGHVFVSTDKGTIHCFAERDGGPARAVEPEIVANPYPPDDLERFYRSLAEKIVEETGIKRGFALILGGGDRLALELARRTRLRIFLVEPDTRKADRYRRLFDAAGLYGSRITVFNDSAASTAFADYFANLIISADGLLGNAIRTPPAELFRLLQPCGGTAYIGQPPASPLKTTAPAEIETWIRDFKKLLTRKEDTETKIEVEGAWVKITRGRLKGAGRWTHQYAEPGNTTTSDDELVRGPLGLLWFGDPGPGEMPSRHASNVAPLAVNGRLFVQGENLLMAYDSYNGLQLWKRRIPGALRLNEKLDCGNLAADDTSLFAAIGDHVLRLDGATGRTLTTYRTPADSQGKHPTWGFIALSDTFLFGSSVSGKFTSNRLFAFDVESGKLLWTHDAGSIMHTTICVGEGRIFFVDRRITEAQRKEGLKGIDPKKRIDRRGNPIPPDVRLVVVLDARTGKKIWERPQYVADCVKIGKAGGDLTMMYAKGVLLLCGQPWNGHFWREFFAGEFSRRSLIALSASDGHPLWSGRRGYRSRPLIVGDTIIAEPWAYDLRTGEPKLRENPITGNYEKWQMSRPGHHCGCIAAGPHALFFRSGSTAYYDLEADCGTAHFGGHRSGCWINCIPANGVVLMPEASSGCICPFAVQCTVTFKPREKGRYWGMYSAVGKPIPVVHMAVNFGAPGDRRDGKGTLWLAYPRPATNRLVFTFDVETKFLPGGRFFAHDGEFFKVEGTEDPWIFASGGLGSTRYALKLNDPGAEPGVYTVKLYFAEPEKNAVGKRQVDIRLQGRRVAEDFDIAGEAGGILKAVVKAFDDIVVKDDLVVELVPKGSTTAPPLLNGLEVIRKRTLPVSISARTFLLSDYRRKSKQTVTVVNHRPEVVSVRLKPEPTAGFTVKAVPDSFRIAPRSAAKAEVEIEASPKVPAGEFILPLRITSGGSALAVETLFVRHTGKEGRIVLNAEADATVQKGEADRNTGSASQLYVDGGGEAMNDEKYSMVFLKFKLDIPGKPLRAKLRIRVVDGPYAQSNDSGRIRLVEGKWSENSVTFSNAPSLGKEVGRLGKVERGQWVERDLELDLKGRKELSLALVPTTTDGASYVSREGGSPPQLVVTFGSEE